MTPLEITLAAIIVGVLALGGWIGWGVWADQRRPPRKPSELEQEE